MKEWYIRVNRRTEGPFTLFDLLRDPRVTLDTLAWKPGMSDWRPICQIPELKEFFERKAGKKPEREKKSYKEQKLPIADEVITLDSPPPSYLLIVLILILICIIFYLIL